ncbi:MAG: glycoside hydrolase family 15 protein [Actinomycetota bacterium]
MTAGKDDYVNGIGRRLAIQGAQTTAPPGRRPTPDGEAFGSPGLAPAWTEGDKDGVGTAYSASSRVWFTTRDGILTEAYYPTVDRPQLRDLQYVITDAKSLLHQEKPDLRTQTKRLHRHVPGYRITNTDPAGNYSIDKVVITDPHLPCILIRTSLGGDPQWLETMQLYALCAPHLGVGGWGNNARVIRVMGEAVLVAEKDGTWLALGATAPFSKASAGYVGMSDSWTDLASDLHMDWEFESAHDGNVALTGRIDLTGRREFTLGLAFGDSLHGAVTALLQSLSVPFERQLSRFSQQWHRACRKLVALEEFSTDGGGLYNTSATLLLSHEDKSFPGALVASLSIPWGETKGDDDIGGYHLVWTRDMVNSSTGLLAAGHTESPLRALVFLAVSQQPDGGFPQNFWIDGRPHWTGIQLDEVAFPIMLAWRLDRLKGLEDFDPYPMVLSAAGFLVKNGPATEQERWEEASGYSPSTLASNIAALLCAACFARQRSDEPTAIFLEEYADFLECHLESWMVTKAGSLHPDISDHYIRINPISIGDPLPDEDPDRGMLAIANRPPGSQWQFQANQVVDAGFLELVRYGIRRADDPLIVDSLAVVDHVLKVQTPLGPSWRRYNHDGYGQRADGSAYRGWGKGHAWPLLTGERGHYELAAGRDPTPYIRALEAFASPTGLLPEQVWSGEAQPDFGMRPGGPTGAAMPLMWAHAEYVKLLRSARDGAVFDLVPEVAERYLGDRRSCVGLEVWKPNRRVSSMRAGRTLRVQAPERFVLHWSCDEWGTVADTPSIATSIGVEYVDIPVPREQTTPIRFTFFWTRHQRWEGHDYVVRPG